MKKDYSEKTTLSLVPWYLGVGICGVGFCVSLYLAYMHHAVHTDFTYTSFCAYSKAVNCETIAESVFSVFLNVPIAVWGMMGYALMGAVCIVGMLRSTQGKRMWMILYVLTVISGLISFILFIISKFYIKSLCIMCLVSYGTNFAILALAMHFRSHRKIQFLRGLKEDIVFLMQRKGMTFSIIGILAGMTVILPFVYPQYWQSQKIMELSNLNHGYTQTGEPWIGAQEPILTIVEYSDYRCFHCRKAYYMMRSIIEKHPDKIRLVHRHFPMDKECNPIVNDDYHKGACILAVWANCAGEQGAFWKMHELLYEVTRIKGKYAVTDLAAQLGLDVDKIETCMSDTEAYRHVSRDVDFGLKRKIEGTPFYEIDGETYTGYLPLEVLKKKLGALE